MLPGWAVVAAGASRLRPAPDALAVAWSVAVFARGRMVAPRPIAHRAAPLASRGIVAMFMLTGRRVMASRAITRRTAVPALRLVLLRRQQSADEREAEHHSCNCFQIHSRSLLALAPLKNEETYHHSKNPSPRYHRQAQLPYIDPRDPGQ